MLSTERSLLPSSKGMEMKDERAIFPQDIIIEILKRLPVKSLIRFQLVCKIWNNLIKSPSFISTHLHYSAHNNPAFLLIRETLYRHNSKLLLSLDPNMKIDVQMPVWKLLTNSIKYDVTLVGSCNGLFFVKNNYIDDECHFYCIYSYSHFLWNPATREVREVPISTRIFSSIPNFGFGFSPVLNDYMIVRIYKDDINYGRNQHEICGVKNHVYYVEVYSLRRGSWNPVEYGVLNRVRYLIYIQAVICNGTMFWLGVVDEFEDDLHMVVSFDIATEIFSLIPIPSSITPHHSDSDVKLTVYENKLAMFWHSYEIGNDDSSFIDLWVMEEGSDASGTSWSWKKKFSIRLPSNCLYPICIWKNVIVFTNMAYDDYPIQPRWLSESEDQVKNGANLCLSLFNLTTNEWTSSCNFINQGFSKNIIFNYVESLVCLQYLQ